MLLNYNGNGSHSLCSNTTEGGNIGAIRGQIEHFLVVCVGNWDRVRYVSDVLN